MMMRRRSSTIGDEMEEEIKTHVMVLVGMIAVGIARS